MKSLGKEMSMLIKEAAFGLFSNGEEARLYTVSNKDMAFSVTDYGCLVTSIILPSHTGRRDDIALGFSSFGSYVQTRKGYFGALVGRFANRIKGARFLLNGQEYLLDKNEGNNYVHGGFDGYNHRLWKGETIETAEGTGIRFTGLSPAGDQGFPGNLSIEINYLLSSSNDLIQIYRAWTDEDTPINITNHSYYNLRGAGNGTILDQELTLYCDSYLEVDGELIPTGNCPPVEGTIYDFRKPKAIGKDQAKTPNNVYDLCFVINGYNGAMKRCAEFFDRDSGRRMIVSTNQPGLQVYSGKRLAGLEGKTGRVYEDYGGLVLETQNMPDAPNHSNFPSCILHPGEIYESKTIYSFSW
jgi:aldose 1-epimerase